MYKKKKWRCSIWRFRILFLHDFFDDDRDWTKLTVYGSRKRVTRLRLETAYG